VAFGVLLSAHADEPGGERTLHRFVVKGHGFRLADFVDAEPGGQRFMPGHDALLERMRRRFATRRDAFTLHPTARSFVQEYLTAMRPRASPDPQRFLAAFANALAAREIKDPTDFVRRFVLEANPLNVKRVRESISTWRELQAEACRLEEMLRVAKEVRSRFVSWGRQKLAKDGADFVTTHAERLRLGIEIKENEVKKQAFKAQLRDIEAREQQLSDENERLDEENKQDALIAARSEAAVSRQVLEGTIRETKVLVIAGAAQVLRSLTPYTGAVQLGRLPLSLPIWARDGVGAAVRLAAICTPGEPMRWAARWAEVGSLAANISTLARAEQSLEQQLEAITADLSNWRRELEELDARIGVASQAGVLMGSQTIRFRQELLARGIAAIAMPDVVEIPDERWAFALEALLGAHREALIVPVDRLDEAFQILFRNRGQLDGCRLVNMRKVNTRTATTRTTRTSQSRAPSGSIAEVAVTDNPDARAFIDAHVGRYVRAENEHELSRLDQGVMSNGKTSQGLGLRVYRDRPPIMGRTAQVAAREAAVARRAELASHAAAGATRKELLQSGKRILVSLADASPPNQVEADARALADAVERLASAERRLGELDGAEPDDTVQAMRDRASRINANKQEAEKLRRESQEAYKTIGALETAGTALVGRSDRLAQREAELSSAQASARERLLIAMSGAEPVAILRESLANRLELNWLGREVLELKREEEDARQRSAESARHMLEAQRRADGEPRRYLVNVGRGDTLAEEADEIDKLIWIDGRVARIEAHELLPHRDRLAEDRGEMERMLKEDLLAKLDERLPTTSSALSGPTRTWQRSRTTGPITNTICC